MDDRTTTLHVTYGDELAQRLRTVDPSLDPVVVRDALRDGPLAAQSGTDDLDAFVALRAAHLAARHGADEPRAREELAGAWARVAGAPGDVVLHVDAEPCVDCAAFVACAIDLLRRAGRGVARSRTGISVARGGDASSATELRPADVAAAAGAWRMLVAGDSAGLRLAAHDGGSGPLSQLPSLLAVRAGGDVPLQEVHPG